MEIKEEIKKLLISSDKESFYLGITMLKEKHINFYNFIIDSIPSLLQTDNRYSTSVSEEKVQIRLLHLVEKIEQLEGLKEEDFKLLRIGNIVKYKGNIMKYNLIIIEILFEDKKLFNFTVPEIYLNLKYFIGSSQTFRIIKDNWKCFELVDITKNNKE